MQLCCHLASSSSNTLQTCKRRIDVRHYTLWGHNYCLSDSWKLYCQCHCQPEPARHWLESRILLCQIRGLEKRNKLCPFYFRNSSFTNEISNLIIKMSCSWRLLFVATIITSCLFSTGHSYTITVDAHAEECFFENVEADTKMGKKTL